MKVGSFCAAVLTKPAVAEVEKVIRLIHDKLVWSLESESLES